VSTRHRWRLSRAELASLRSPLEPQPLQKPEDVIPDAWDGPHAGRRLVDAFATLRSLPVRRVGTRSGFWPDYLYEWADLLAQQESGVIDTEFEERRRRLQQYKPSTVEISRMEGAIRWPAKYVPLAGMAHIVQRVALAIVREPSEPWLLLADLEHSSAWVYEQNNLGLELIAAGLRGDAIEVY